MASSITALTSGGGIAIAGDTSGNLDLKTGNGTYTASVPQATGTVMVSGNQPAFAAYASVDQTISNDTQTKVTFTNEIFDTANCFSSSRFTPNVAGYYSVYAFYEWQGVATDTRRDIYIFKNGGAYRRGQIFSRTGGNTQNEVTAILYLNGSTDYIEIYADQGSGGNLTIYNGNGQNYNGFEACLIRNA